MAAFYSEEARYPAWTDRIRWSQVVDMSAYTRRGTCFKRFENARDALAAQGRGVLDYPAGVYDFSDAPMDGPDGRGLMLCEGVVIRGESPREGVCALDGPMHLPTRFAFGFNEKANAIDVDAPVIRATDPFSSIRSAPIPFSDPEMPRGIHIQRMGELFLKYGFGLFVRPGSMILKQQQQ